MSSKAEDKLLDELNKSLDLNYAYSSELIESLFELSSDSSDDKTIGAIHALQKTFCSFTTSLADLRDENNNALESYNTKKKLEPFANVAKSRLSATLDESGNPSALLSYIDEINTGNDLSLEHINLIGRLSSILIEMLPTELDDSTQNLELSQILEAYDINSTVNEDTECLKEKLLDWIDSVKLEKARYSLENQHILRDSLKNLTLEVTRWRENYDSIEGMMFGENANSISQMLHKVQELRPQLNGGSREDQEEDVIME
ncbi:LAQU0S08e00562g1_1 [Lachancea quebecensis]|uniref:LAQU0S08e00562g1_1 n=1 Tax=Lachancea quebecensis TaxID=1654605 RepID=A0A0P1KS82_9SACH|nr:LAQU0S08e00562g1_1 [Lachancea quebecensis]